MGNNVQQPPRRPTTVSGSCNIVRGNSIVAGRRKTAKRKTKAITEGNSRRGASEGSRGRVSEVVGCRGGEGEEGRGKGIEGCYFYDQGGVEKWGGQGTTTRTRG